MSVVLEATLPPGYGTVNVFVAVKGGGGAAGFVSFVAGVFDGRETLAARTIDSDDLLIHAEVQVGNSTIMVCDSKPDWPFTPALIQVYVGDIDEVVRRAVTRGATVVTTATPFHGNQRLARLKDPWHNLWWLFEYGDDSVAPSEAPEELPSWRPDPGAPPSYVKQTVMAAFGQLRPPQ